MRIPDQRNRPFTGANMTPMIDVVFLLIIFFLVSSHLARQESKLPVELPVAASHDEVDLDPVSLTVTLNAEQALMVRGVPSDLRTLRGVLQDVVAMEGDTASLRIRTDGKVPYRLVEPILKSAAAVGLTDIKLAVKESSR